MDIKWKYSCTVPELDWLLFGQFDCVTSGSDKCDSNF